MARARHTVPSPTIREAWSALRTLTRQFVGVEGACSVHVATSEGIRSLDVG